MDSFESEGSLRERPIGELMKRLSAELSVLIRQELDLAKAEIVEKGKIVTVGASLFGGAAMLGLLAAGALTATIILALSQVIAPWIASLIVSVVYAAVAGIFLAKGKSSIAEASPIMPTKTIETVKEDVQWAKTQIKSAAK